MYKRDRYALYIGSGMLTAVLLFFLLGNIVGFLPESLRLSGGHGRGSGTAPGTVDPDIELGIPIGDFRYRFSSEGSALVTMPLTLHYKKETLIVPQTVEWQETIYTVTTISPTAFIYQRFLKTLLIPPTVTRRNFFILADPATTHLENIFVDSQNPWMKSEDGIVFNREMTELLVYPPARQELTCELPQTVTSIAPNAVKTLRAPVVFHYADGSTFTAYPPGKELLGADGSPTDTADRRE